MQKKTVILFFSIICILFLMPSGLAKNCGDGVANCSCFDTVTASVTLQADDNVTNGVCSGQWFSLNVGADNIVIDCNDRNITANITPATPYPRAININGYNNVTVRNCNIFESFFGIVVENSNDIKISDVYLARNQWQVIGIWDSTDVVVEDSEIYTEDSWNHGIYIKKSENVTVDNCYFYLDDNWGDSVSIHNSSFIYIKNSEMNLGTSELGWASEMDGVNNTFFYNNTVFANSSDNGIGLGLCAMHGPCFNITISDNNFSSMSDGIYGGCAIDGITIEDNIMNDLGRCQEIFLMDDGPYPKNAEYDNNTCNNADISISLTIFKNATACDEEWPTYAFIEFESQGDTDITLSDPNSFMDYGESFFSLDTANAPSFFNVTAYIYLDNNNGTNFSNNLFYKAGTSSSADEIVNKSLVCNANSNPSCTNISYNGSGVSFEVSHFTGFASGGNSSLFIWNDGPISQGQTLTFSAWYNDTINGTSIANASCNISLQGSWYEMNDTNTIHEYRKTFANPANANYRVKCAQTNFKRLNATDTYKVNSTVGVPEFSDYVFAAMVLLITGLFLINIKKQKI